VRTLKAGAVDFIEKPFPATALSMPVLSGLSSIDSEPVHSAEPHDFAQRLKSLTPRERDVMDALIEGRQNKEIGDKLGISSRTVDVYRARVMAKMAAGRLAALVCMAIAAGHGI
jgi:FixJ family two-component response regulator